MSTTTGRRTTSPTTRTMPRERLSADERRLEIVDKAVIAFAVGGLHGTSTEAIARMAGVTQPYLFRLFGTKRELFISAVRAAFDRMRTGFERAAEEAGGREAGAEAVLRAMGDAYDVFLRDRTLLLLQLQAYAACDDAEVRAAVRDGFGAIVETVQDRSGAPDRVIRDWLAMGMLWNVAVAMDLPHLKTWWASLCMDDEGAMDHS
jgi:AcrR family transcriptional regulator